MTTTAAPTAPWPELDPAAVRQALLAGTEIALLDVREEDPYAQGHPLWAANLPLSTLELNAWRRIPRRDTLIVLYGSQVGRDGPDGPAEDLAPLAAARLQALGYTRVHLLTGGLAGWRRAGGELFIDVNVPSKAFGELVEAERHTPSLSAQDVQALIDSRADVVVVDARRFEEYQAMSIPTGTSVPGAELVLRVRELAPDPATRVIVNCAGRTRSIIGTQSLVNAGLPNPVAALRNGTIGWLLAGQTLDHGASRRFPAAVSAATRAQAQADARAVADRAGVRRIAWADLATLDDPARTSYRYDVRTPEEYAQGHLPGFGSAPGGQLVQETDHNAPVRGARIVLADDDGVRANMTASWLAQMGWETHVVDGAPAAAFSETGPWQPAQPADPDVPTIAPGELATLLGNDHGAAAGVALLDLTPSARYVERHIPGAWYVLRAQLAQALVVIPPARRYVLTCGSSQLARWAAHDLLTLLAQRDQAPLPVHVLDGGTQAWIAQGLPLEHGETRLASPRIDRYRRPYEGTDAPAAAMQAYLDWEFGLVAQLGRDGTHGFQVI
ncbi:MAG: Thiosulfate sulfurtransferase GlpE [Paracidovorax wautersii]|uniref:Thiosulfate sulfurtransferase GlpE n=1 Tax=Paracidovorax wautersii TaxID=1177982 RepID=A0A7V8FQQ7_9BURK|nr:MAG: Thiosulfate sulfurtransferase GlpE [Paracidovorax wautersii]